jgi:hypothetical protein
MDGFEERFLLSASPVINPAALVVASPLMDTGSIHATSVSQAVIEIRNSSSLNVSMQFRWNSSSAWSSLTLAAGHYEKYWINSSSSLSPQIQFDQSVLPGWQGKTYSLSYFTYTGGGTPPNSAARLYAFQNVPGGVDLYSVTTRAVTGFTNSSSITVAFQFRWNASSSWSSTVFLAPGKSWYFWDSPPDASSPQVQFDQSILPGWQTKSYSLSFNIYEGNGTPPFSSARVYTFRNVPGGVNLYS